MITAHEITCGYGTGADAVSAAHVDDDDDDQRGPVTGATVVRGPSGPGVPGIRGHVVEAAWGGGGNENGEVYVIFVWRGGQ